MLSFFGCYRVEEEVMGGPQMGYVQLTLDVDYFQGHMEVLFSHVGKHRLKFFMPGSYLIMFFRTGTALMALLDNFSA